MLDFHILHYYHFLILSLLVFFTLLFYFFFLFLLLSVMLSSIQHHRSTSYLYHRHVCHYHPPYHQQFLPIIPRLLVSLLHYRVLPFPCLLPPPISLPFPRIGKSITWMDLLCGGILTIHVFFFSMRIFFFFFLQRLVRLPSFCKDWILAMFLCK